MLFHATMLELTAGLPPSILAAAAGRAARRTRLDVSEIDSEHAAAPLVVRTLKEVQEQYARKKVSSREKRTAVRAGCTSAKSDRFFESAKSADENVPPLSLIAKAALPSPPVSANVSESESDTAAGDTAASDSRTSASDSDSDSDSDSESDTAASDSSEEPYRLPLCRPLSVPVPVFAKKERVEAPSSFATTTRARWGLP